MLISCSECGKQVSDKAASCPNCGNPIAKYATQVNYVPVLHKSEKSRVVYVLLGLCLGWLGIHNFYIGKAGKGILQLLMMVLGLMLTLIAVGYIVLFVLCIWILVDICSVTRDADGRVLS